jgi:hypothetical protein
MGVEGERHAAFMVRIPAMDLASFIAPWAESMFDQIPGLELFDAHTHLGQNDPDGMTQTLEELLAVLGSATPAAPSCSRCTSSRGTRPPTTW